MNLGVDYNKPEHTYVVCPVDTMYMLSQISTLHCILENGEITNPVIQDRHLQNIISFLEGFTNGTSKVLLTVQTPNRNQF